MKKKAIEKLEKTLLDITSYIEKELDQQPNLKKALEDRELIKAQLESMKSRKSYEFAKSYKQASLEKCCQDAKDELISRATSEEIENFDALIQEVADKFSVSVDVLEDALYEHFEQSISAEPVTE